MLKLSVRVLRLLPFLVTATLAAGCGGSGEGAFVKACMHEGANAAGQMMDREMGVSREEFCKCGAKTAKSTLSGKAFHAMILDMEGKKQEAAEITMKMTVAEQQALFMGMGQVFQNCVKGGG